MPASFLLWEKFIIRMRPMTDESNNAGTGNKNVYVTINNTQQPIGNSVQPSEYADPVLRYRSKTTYNILAILFGPLGVHEFYFGYKAAGWWMLLICIFTGGSAAPFLWIWAIIDIFTTTAPKGYFRHENVFLPIGTTPQPMAETADSLQSISSVAPTPGHSRHFYYAIYLVIGIVGLFFMTALIGAMIQGPSHSEKKKYHYTEKVSDKEESNASHENNEQQPAPSTFPVIHENISDISWEEVCALTDVDSELSDFQIEERKKDYVGKRVKWTGKFEEADKGIFGVTTVVFRVGTDTGFFTKNEVKCKLVNDKNMSIRATRYEKEKDITIVGTIEKIDSFDGYEVILKDAIIVDK